jgi:hypothetical protein
MKRLCLLLMAAVATFGCRSSQQPTNPFLRTTVPPPGTGEAAVIVPGDPYNPAAQPVAPPPAVPVQPAPQQVVTQVPDFKNATPGGDYMYHQSSLDGGDESVQVAADGTPSDELAVNAAAPTALRLGGKSEAVSEALAMAREAEPIETASFADYGGSLPGEELPSSRPAHQASMEIAAPQPLDHASERAYDPDATDTDVPEPEDFSPYPDASSNTDLSARNGLA